MKRTKGRSAMKYGTRDPRALSPKDAQAVGEAIDMIAKRHGAATPELLVKEAKDASHPAHKLIWAKWTDAEAAWQHRLRVASSLLAAVRIEVHGSTVPAFINTNVGDGYVPARAVFEDVDATAKLLADSLRDLEAWYRRALRIRDAANAKHLEPVFQAVEKVLPKQEKAA